MAFSHSEPASVPAPTAVDLASHDPEKQIEGTDNVERADSTVVQHGQHIIDPALERRIVRKIDMRLIPLVTVMCTFQCFCFCF